MKLLHNGYMRSLLALIALSATLGCAKTGVITPTAAASAVAPKIAIYSGTLTQTQKKIVESARDQLTWNTSYYNPYVKLSYPMGDLPKDKGVCTDVVVRSLRAAGYDLQKLIYEDMKKAWGEYPRYKGLSKPDPNIDHRRVPNQMRFFKRHGQELTVDFSKKDQWKPGDFVTWKLTPSNLDHIGVLSDRLNNKGLPLVIHNMSTTLEEDVLESWKVTGHFRFPAESGR